MDNLASFLAGALVGCGAVLLLSPQNNVPIPLALEELKSQAQEGFNKLEDKGSAGWGIDVGLTQEHTVRDVEMSRDGSRSAL
ncbi:hypothetical protein [Candidatus Nitrospira nitrificans]|uniref:YtxH domain-containing protein n=1 Tax=Candidatus Nitrospira nitrificans TaxID=1742973 RepID=A0A0S4LSF1_9BACT|nr:hypothetical protein [Candidatus Nitrospira nitrificans]CUS39480.1 exported hypothetical protein [Candidatus Nitrospira nitrificans]